MSEFMGKDGFQWFVGVVEDRQDPKTLGRLRVRCLGYHSEVLNQLPTADLPWAHVMNPITSATVSGLGQSPLGAVEGTWVVGFFQDGVSAQQPIIIGTLPGVPSELPTKIVPEGPTSQYYAGNGFKDYKNANYPKYKDETDVNRLAVGDDDNPHSTLTIRKADRDINGVGIGRADFDSVDVRRANTGVVIVDGDDGTSFNEPVTPYDAKYPYNHVHESESGHIRELDDTPGAERIHERHSSGTGYEIHPKGDKVTRVKKDNYTLVTGDDFAHIKGDQSTTTDGGVRVFVNADGASKDGHYTIEVGNNANVNIQVNKGDVNVVTTQGNINLKSGKNIHMDATQGIYMKSAGMDVEINGQWSETTKNKTENTGRHTMNAKFQDINGTSRIDLN